MMSKSAMFVAITLFLAGIVVPTALGMQWSDYALATDYISELGEEGSPVQALTRWVAFLPTGIAGLAAACLLWPMKRWGPAAALVALGLAVGYLGAAFVPCDAGCPTVNASTSQSVHNVLGLLEYALCFIGLCWATTGMTMKQTRFATGLAAITVLVGFALMVTANNPGAWQRLADWATMTWLAFALVKVHRIQVRLGR